MLYHLFQARARQTGFSFALSLPWVASSRRSKSYYMLRSPPASSPRELATPLVFLSAKDWDKSSADNMRSFASIFAERGYTTLEIDLGLPVEEASTSSALMHHFETELASHIRLAAIPFAPVLFAKSGGALIAQTYISSNPASGLVLISPPPSNSSSEATSLLSTPLPEFDYEPRFPLLIVDTPDHMKAQKDSNRLLQDSMVDTVVTDELSGTDMLMSVEKWMDSVGV